MTRFRDAVRKHFELEATRYPITPGLRSSVVAGAQIRAAEQHRSQWIPGAVAAVLALAIIGSLLAVGNLRRLHATPASPKSTLASCPITRAPQPPYIPPQPYPSTPPGGEVWYGTPNLWTTLPPGGTWTGLPYNNGAYTQKVFFWSDGNASLPQLTVGGIRIDGSAKPMTASAATSAVGIDIGSSMLVLVEIPSAGCWEITGKYKLASLSFVVWIPA
jgi:hypothetical protein